MVRDEVPWAWATATCTGDGRTLRGRPLEAGPRAAVTAWTHSVHAIVELAFVLRQGPVVGQAQCYCAAFGGPAGAPRLSDELLFGLVDDLSAVGQVLMPGSQYVIGHDRRVGPLGDHLELGDRILTRWKLRDVELAEPCFNMGFTFDVRKSHLLLPGLGLVTQLARLGSDSHAAEVVRVDPGEG